MQSARGRMRKLAHRPAVFPTQFRWQRPPLSDQPTSPPAAAASLTQSIPAGIAATADLVLLRHELRTPLTGMLGLAELLSALDLPAKATLWLATLQACGQQMASLIDRALQSEQSRSALYQHQTVNGLQLMEMLVAAHWPAARAYGTSLMLVFHPEALGLWQIDSVALRQALDNLLANAIRFSHQGYVVLEIRALEQRQEGLNLLEISIEDSGPDPKIIASNLQEDCEFADRTYRMSSRGRGLQVVAQACQRFAGNLQRSSSNAGGSRFALTLNALFPGGPKPIQPFRPALLNNLHCILNLEVSQQRALAVMLECLEIGSEVVDQKIMPAPDALTRFQVLICTQAHLPRSLQQGMRSFSANSIWLIVSIPKANGPELYQQPLPEPLFQADLQTALLRCLVVQGMAVCQQPDIQQ
jgi:anti-sigma regulatory factor (Ser/Thr protein kinase)